MLKHRFLRLLLKSALFILLIFSTITTNTEAISAPASCSHAIYSHQLAGNLPMGHKGKGEDLHRKCGLSERADFEAGSPILNPKEKEVLIPVFTYEEKGTVAGAVYSCRSGEVEKAGNCIILVAYSRRGRRLALRCASSLSETGG